MVISFKNTHSVFIWLHHFTFPPAVHKGSNFSIFSPTCYFVSLFFLLLVCLYNSHPNACDVTQQVFRTSMGFSWKICLPFLLQMWISFMEIYWFEYDIQWHCECLPETILHTVGWIKFWPVIGTSPALSLHMPNCPHLWALKVVWQTVQTWPLFKLHCFSISISPSFYLPVSIPLFVPLCRGRSQSGWMVKSTGGGTSQAWVQIQFYPGKHYLL